jgi:hypothetical protein
MSNSRRAYRRQSPGIMENPLGAQKAIRARELVAVVSPDRKPPLYGQVFQSDAEVQRQWSALTFWAAENGLLLSPEQAAKLRRGREGGGEEHFVYFDEHEIFVIKETRPDSWANRASAGQYFQRWVDLGTLWPALEAELVGISDHSIFVRQRFIDGDLFGDRAVLEADMSANGWERIGPIRFRHISTGAVVTDAKPSNVIRGRDGSVWPFDVVVESTGSLG